MNKLDEFNKIIIKNTDNKPLVDEFIRYYMFIYTGYATSDKSAKENYYKLLAIKKTIDIISKMKKKLESGEELGKIKGIGPKTVARVNEILKTGKLSEIKDFQLESSGVSSELANIYGIGPSKASFYYDKYKIKTIDDFIKKINSGEITVTKQIELGLKYRNILSTKIPRILIARIENYINDIITKLDPNFICVICGSYRREKDFSSDIDFLITHRNLYTEKNKVGCPRKLCEFYLHNIVSTLEENFIIGDAKLTENYSTHFQGFASVKDIPKLPKCDFDINSVIRVDFIIVPSDDFYTALVHFTGSGEFNQKLRAQAKAMDMKLSEYGLFKKEPSGKYKKIIIHNENDIFKELLLKYIPPNKR